MINNDNRNKDNNDNFELGGVPYPNFWRPTKNWQIGRRQMLSGGGG